MKKIRGIIALFISVCVDTINYVKFSGLVSNNSEQKLLALIIYNYHSLEKGLSMNQIRHGFGEKKIISLLFKVRTYIKRGYNKDLSQFITACSVLKEYYILHQDANYDISDYFNQEDYKMVVEFAQPNIGGAQVISKSLYFKNRNSNFENFAKSRHSVRHFNEIPINIEKLKLAVELAKYCPSACNRQTAKVYLVDNKDQIYNILKIQKGIDATSDMINQLLVITGNRNHFFASGERHQHFVDGGIFINSLLLSLHYYEIAACPLHWSLNFRQDNRIREIVKFSKSEKVISLIAVGNIFDDFKVPNSNRKTINEIFVKVK